MSCAVYVCHASRLVALSAISAQCCSCRAGWDRLCRTGAGLCGCEVVEVRCYTHTYLSVSLARTQQAYKSSLQQRIVGPWLS